MKSMAHYLGRLFVGALFWHAIASPLLAQDNPLAWPPVTAQAKPHAYWWWMGSAVDTNNLTRELTRYHAAGLGGVHIIPIYGAKGWESKYIDYLSPRWMEMLDYTVREAKRLGMEVDMTTGTGWCFGGPHVSNDEANASMLSREWQLSAGQTISDKLKPGSIQALMAFGPDGQKLDLLKKISADGAVAWQAPGDGWKVYAISQKPSGQKVKRAAPGGEGWMLNLAYPKAMTDYLQWFTDAFANYHGALPRAQYHDSYEYRNDWSPVFFDEFQKRRGYRLQDELDAFLSGQPADRAARVLGDYRKTLSEIMAEETIPMWVKWSHAHGFITRNEAHGSPGNWLDLYADADIPETEMFHLDRNKLISKFASSAAHVTGKPLVGAETGTWLTEHFTETLADMKYLQDDMFLSGINHIFYHGTCYSPDEVPWPGWVFYASYEMNPRNAVWHDVSALNAYATRVQSVLQSGQPDNDVLLYWNLDDFWMQPGATRLPQLTVHAREWFEDQPIGKVAQELWDKGYSFDYVSDAQLKGANVVDGKIQMPGGKYQVIVVPAAKYIPLATFKNLHALAEKGAMVVFQGALPGDVSGLENLEANQKEFKDLLATLKFSAQNTLAGNVQVATVGRGAFFVRDTLAPSVWHDGDSESMVWQGLSFVRRTFDGGWNYFIANRTPTNFDGWITPARPGKSFVLLDPVTGATGVAGTRQNTFGQTEVHLQLRAGESVILRALAEKTVAGPAWNYWQTDGQPTEITGTWSVKFISGGPVLPADYQTARLASWTTFPDTNCQAFAGTAKYEITFAAPDSTGENFELNLGALSQSARVRLNGKDYGTLITPPFRVVVDHLKPTGNVLAVEVTSTSANRIRDLDRRGVKWQNFNDINFVNINYKKFDASNWPLADCGLLGPVTLTPVKAEPVKP